MSKRTLISFITACIFMQMSVSGAEQSLSITKPTGGDELPAGLDAQIFWTSTGIESITLEYSLDAGETWTILAEHVDDSKRNYLWELPESEHQECIIRISDADNATISAESEGFFSILKPYVRLTAPLAGELFVIGNTTTISWDHLLNNDLCIEYSIDSGFTWSIFEEKVNTQLESIDWYLSEYGSDSCLIRITDISKPEITDTLDEPIRLSRRVVTTEDGLWRFYGKHKNMGKVSFMTFDSNGTLWCLAEGGILFSYDGFKWTQYKTDIFDEYEYITNILFYSEGEMLFLTTQAIVRFDGISWYRKEYGYGTKPTCIVEDKEGTVWLGRGPYLSTLNDDLTWKDVVHLEADWGIRRSTVSEILVDSYDRKWLVIYEPSTDEYGYPMTVMHLLILDGDNYIEPNITLPQPHSVAVPIVMDMENNFYLALANIFYMFNGVEWSKEILTEQIKAWSGDYYIGDFMLDNNGYIWLAMDYISGRPLKSARSNGDSQYFRGFYRFKPGESGTWLDMYENFDMAVRTKDEDLGPQILLQWYQSMCSDESGAAWFADRDGLWKFEDSSMTGIEEPTPRPVSLFGNFPNPFNTMTTISFELPEPMFTELIIYNLMGQKVRTLVLESMNAGYHSVLWDGRNDDGGFVSSGVYFSRLKNEGQSLTSKMLLIK